MRRIAVLALLTLAGCGDPGPPLLAERDTFHGHIRIDSRIGEQVRVLEGDLEFDRATGRIEFVRPGDPTITLSRAGDGAPLLKFVDGEPTPPGNEDLSDLVVLLAVVFRVPEQSAEVVRESGRYSITHGLERLVVEYEESI